MTGVHTGPALSAAPGGATVLMKHSTDSAGYDQALTARLPVGYKAKAERVMTSCDGPGAGCTRART
jgi:hypothetical protein